MIILCQDKNWEDKLVHKAGEVSRSSSLATPPLFLQLIDIFS
jgi:hypothetical protein